ncbi:MAG: dephospho-CoA kinase, partial [bacterium]
IRNKIREAKLLNKKYIIVNAAVLKEMKLLPFVDKVVVVLAGERTRLARLVKCGLSRSEAAARIKTQEKASRYRKIADFVIENNKTIEHLKEKVKRIISAL